MPGLTVVHLSVAGTYVCLLTMFCFAVKCYQVVGNGGMGWSCFTIWSWVHHSSCCYVLVAWQKLNLSLSLKHLPTARHLLKTVCFGLNVYCYLFAFTNHWTVTHHTHPFNGPFSGTTWVGQYQKGKTNLDFTEARGSEWQWHQLGRMQVCILLQTDNHASTSPLSFLLAGCPSCRPTNSIKALDS